MRLITDEQVLILQEVLAASQPEDCSIQKYNKAVGIMQALPEVEVVGKVETCATHYEAKRHSVLSFTDKPIPLDTPLYATKEPS